MYYPTDPVKSKILAIEKQPVKEWYWDIQVPNTNNYVANGCLHHNSAKSILMAHIIVVHCHENPGARVLLGRRALPDLKATIFQKVVEHIEEDLREGVDYHKNDSTATITFSNGSQIISRSWADNRFSKVRSLELSAACIEELTESPDDRAYMEIKMRVGRLPHIKNNFIICATNPDGPQHWAYKYFIESEVPTRHVYYSVTEDNPFLPTWYIEQLKTDLDPKMARRMLYGEWLEITSEVVYHAYDSSVQYLKDTEYTIRPNEPIWLSWDFNIGEGKPMSIVAGQFINDTLHLFKEWVIEGMRTEDSCDEIEASGIFEMAGSFIITGDASGKHRDTRSKGSDYDIIKRYFANVTVNGLPLNFESRVPVNNPQVRLRHNTVNAYCKNANGDVRLYVYKGCKTVDEGLRLTSLKKNGNYIEDDSKYYQHITTAIGYLLMRAIKPVKQNKTILM